MLSEVRDDDSGGLGHKRLAQEHYQQCNQSDQGGDYGQDYAPALERDLAFGGLGGAFGGGAFACCCRVGSAGDVRVGLFLGCFRGGLGQLLGEFRIVFVGSHLIRLYA